MSYDAMAEDIKQLLEDASIDSVVHLCLILVSNLPCGFAVPLFVFKFTPHALVKARLYCLQMFARETLALAGTDCFEPGHYVGADSCGPQLGWACNDGSGFEVPRVGERCTGAC